MTQTRELANCIRALSVDAVEKAKSGHPGMPMGMADAATVLFAKYLKFDAKAPDWPDRDRFVLSNGHGSMLLYSLLYLAGYPKMTIEEIKNFRQLGSITPGHPEHDETPGVESTTGPLGQGLSNAVGMAVAEQLLAKQYGEQVVNHRTWVFVGDGCLMEGVGQEAISLAGHLGLGKLIVVFDDNSITIDGAIELSRSEDVKAKIKACNWRVLEADGHDSSSIDAAYKAAIKEGDQPVFIDLKTVIGYGSPAKQGTAGSHGNPLGEQEITAAKENWGWTAKEFEIPADLLKSWREIGQRGKAEHEQWQSRVNELPQEKIGEFERRIKGDLPAKFADRTSAKCHELAENPAKIATRKASQISLEYLIEELPELVGGSADLTGSNLTLVAGMEVYKKGDPGRYIHFGVREFAMSGALNGMALHGGFIPYGGTFLTFSDYARNAMRMAAMMKLRVVFVMTHDSIGLGEDGPTHQPVEHLASLRSIPGLNVFRPADQVETFECWELAMQKDAGPSVLALSRQGCEQLRNEAYPVNQCAKGAYLIKESQDQRALTILATGSEVALAIEAAKALDQKGHPTSVVSMPCWELFEQQEDKYKEVVLGNTPRLAIEAAAKFGWGKYLACDDDMIGMTSFGVSAPASDAYKHLGITVDALIERGTKLLKA